MIVALLAALGGVTGVIKAAGFLTERLDRRKDERRTFLQQHVTESIEAKRLELEREHIDDESVKLALWKMLEAKTQEVEALRAAVRELEHTESLSRPIRLKIYAAIREMKKQVDILELLIARQTHHELLSGEMEILRQKVDDLERSVP